MEKDKINQWTESIFSGLKLSLTAFVIHTIIALIGAIIINIAANDFVNLILYGGINTGGTTIISKTIRMTYMVFNLSLFNNLMLGQSVIRIGLLILVAMPILSLYLSKKYTYTKGEVKDYTIQVMLSTSISYAILQFVISMIIAIQSTGKTLTFASLRNLIFTFVFVFLIQIIMEFLSDSRVKNLSGMKALKKTIIYIGSLIGIISIAGFIYKGISFSTSIMILFNIIAYLIMMLLGGSFFGLISEEVVKLNLINLVTGNTDSLVPIQKYMPSLLPIPKYISILVLLLFAVIIGILIYCIMKIKKKNYIQNLLLYALGLSMVNVILSYCSRIRIEEFPFIGQVDIGFSLVSSFFMPFIFVNIIGWIRYWVLNKRSS